MPGLQKCFTLHNNVKITWSEAQDYCTSLEGEDGKKGRLAVDDTPETHEILNRLLTTRGHRVWLGGKTEPFYWNWAPTKTGQLEVKEHFSLSIPHVSKYSSSVGEV